MNKQIKEIIHLEKGKNILVKHAHALYAPREDGTDTTRASVDCASRDSLYIETEGFLTSHALLEII